MPDNAAKPVVTAVRPTKKQRALLDFISKFIDEHGYSPSYREIMNGCNYNSIATVAVHINNLISRGHLRKRDHSARSLELTNPSDAPTVDQPEGKDPREHEAEAWLTSKVTELFKRLQTEDDEIGHADLQTVVATLELLGLQATAAQFAEQLVAIDTTDRVSH